MDGPLKGVHFKLSQQQVVGEDRTRKEELAPTTEADVPCKYINPIHHGGGCKINPLLINKLIF